MADNDKSGEKGSGKRATRPRPEGGVRSPRPPKTPRVKGDNGATGPARAKKPAVPATEEQAQKAKDWWSRLRRYLKSVRSEFGRITWPGRNELRSATIVVIATLVVVTFYLYVVDKLMGLFFTRLGG